MDQRYVQMLEVCRPQLRVVDHLDQLLPYLKAGSTISTEEVCQLRTLTTQVARADKIIELILKKGSQGFSTLCVALESTYPHILTTMFTASSSSGIPVVASKYGQRTKRDLFDLQSPLGPPPVGLPPPIPSLVTNLGDSLSSKGLSSFFFFMICWMFRTSATVRFVYIYVRFLLSHVHDNRWLNGSIWNNSAYNHFIFVVSIKQNSYQVYIIIIPNYIHILWMR